MLERLSRSAAELASRIRSGRLALAVVLVCALAAGCQPPQPEDDGDEAPALEATAALGAPGQRLPSTLEGVVDLGQQLAVEWQDDPRLAELAVTLDADAAIAEARLTFLAGDADRFLLLRLTPDGASEERPTLAALSLQPIPAPAVAQIPTFPGDALEPAALLDAAAGPVGSCLDVRPTELLYTTGAPVAWDGQGWTVSPVWEVSILASGEGPARGVVVDPTAGEPTGEGCVGA